MPHGLRYTRFVINVSVSISASTKSKKSPEPRSFLDQGERNAYELETLHKANRKFKRFQVPGPGAEFALGLLAQINISALACVGEGCVGGCPPGYVPIVDREQCLRAREMWNQLPQPTQFRQN